MKIKVDCCEGMENARTWGLIHHSKIRPPKGMAFTGYFIGDFTYVDMKLIPKWDKPFMYLDYCPFCRKIVKE